MPHLTNLFQQEIDKSDNQPSSEISFHWISHTLHPAGTS